MTLDPPGMTPLMKKIICWDLNPGSPGVVLPHSTTVPQDIGITAENNRIYDPVQSNNK